MDNRPHHANDTFYSELYEYTKIYWKFETRTAELIAIVSENNTLECRRESTHRSIDKYRTYTKYDSKYDSQSSRSCNFVYRGEDNENRSFLFFLNSQPTRGGMTCVNRDDELSLDPLSRVWSINLISKIINSGFDARFRKVHSDNERNNRKYMYIYTYTYTCNDTNTVQLTRHGNKESTVQKLSMKNSENVNFHGNVSRPKIKITLRLNRSPQLFDSDWSRQSVRWSISHLRKDAQCRSTNTPERSGGYL